MGKRHFFNSGDARFRDRQRARDTGITFDSRFAPFSRREAAAPVPALQEENPLPIVPFAGLPILQTLNPCDYSILQMYISKTISLAERYQRTLEQLLINLMISAQPLMIRPGIEHSRHERLYIRRQLAHYASALNVLEVICKGGSPLEWRLFVQSADREFGRTDPCRNAPLLGSFDSGRAIYLHGAEEVADKAQPESGSALYQSAHVLLLCNPDSLARDEQLFERKASAIIRERYKESYERHEKEVSAFSEETSKLALAKLAELGITEETHDKLSIRLVQEYLCKSGSSEVDMYLKVMVDCFLFSESIIAELEAEKKKLMETFNPAYFVQPIVDANLRKGGMLILDKSAVVDIPSMRPVDAYDTVRVYQKVCNSNVRIFQPACGWWQAPACFQLLLWENSEHAQEPHVKRDG